MQTTIFFPKGARLLQILNDQRGFDGMQAVIGLPVEPSAYISWACTLVHPNTQPVKMPVGMERAIQLHSPGASVELRKARIAWTKTMLSLYEQCKDDELELERSRPDHLKSVLLGKRFELMKRCLDAVSYPDSAIAAEASEGLPLVG